MPKNDQDIPFGQWLKLSPKLLWCYEAKVNKEKSVTAQFIRFNEHSNSGAWMIRKGWAKVEHDGAVFKAEPNQWIIVKPCQRVQSFATDTVILSIGFQAMWPSGEHLFDDGLSLVLDGKDHPELESKGSDLVASMNPYSVVSWSPFYQPISLDSYLVIQGIFHSWFDALVRAMESCGIKPNRLSQLDPRVNRAMSVLVSHRWDRSMAVDDVAEQVGLSTAHLNRLFKAALGVTPAKYLENLRFEYARNALRLPNSRIADVADELGFSQISNFSAWFKKHSGMSPRHFLKAGN